MNGNYNSKVWSWSADDQFESNFYFTTRKYVTEQFVIAFYFTKLEKYEYVGRLLRPGEEPNSYSDEEDESSETPAAKANKTDENIKNLNSSSTTTTVTSTDKPKDE